MKCVSCNEEIVGKSYKCDLCGRDIHVKCIVRFHDSILCKECYESGWD